MLTGDELPGSGPNDATVTGAARTRSKAKSVPMAIVAALVAGALIVSWAASTQTATALNAGGRTHPGNSAPKALPKTAPKTLSKARAAPQLPGVLVATSKVASVPIYPASGPPAPGARVSESLANPNSIGAPLVFLVHAVKPGWLQVYLPQRPNESLGWIPTRDVTLTREPDRIVVNLGSRHIELLDGTRVLFQTTVAVGSPDSPTPTGSFYVTEVVKVTGPLGEYGPYALGLSAFSNTYFSFDGGPGQIAIHGTDQPWVIGQYASHGCVRLQNSEITTLAQEVEPGTPVDIVA